MGLIMLGGLALMLFRKKWSDVLLLCTLPLTVIWAFVHGVSGVSEGAFVAGMVLIAIVPLLEKPAQLIQEKLSTQDAACETEDDILDNKTKWRLIIAGYVFFIIFAVFSVVALIRLNAKINTLYEHSKDLDTRIEELSGDTR